MASSNAKNDNMEPDRKNANGKCLDIAALEGWLWEAANILRGPVDATDFKTFIFPLLFFKRVSDVFDEEFEQALQESGGDVAYAQFAENHRFQMPEGCHWNDVRAKSTNIGQAIQRALREIEKANPSTLYGIFGDAPWSNKDRLSDALLRDLIEHFSRFSLANRSVEDDVLGQAYEYLIKKFADQTNRKAGEFVMVDEAHRTQEGDLGRKMREALPNAFLFGLTGTPINRADRNTFWAFGADEDANGYMSRYSFEESIRDKATLPLHFEARLVQLRIDKGAIDDAFKNITSDMADEDAAELSKMAAKMGVLVKSSERIQTLAKDIVEHYQAKVEPNGFKAQVVTFDRESCHLFKQEFDKLLPPEASAVVMTVASGETEFKSLYERSKDEEERLLDQYRDPHHPLKFLIVTSKLLTGFDAPILQVMYLDKPMKDHTLLQAICRTNRPYPGKSHGLIVDYLGVFDDVGRALVFDEKSIQLVITNLEELKSELQNIWKKCVDYFPGVDRKVSGYEGLIAAQQCLPDNEKRDAFATDFSVFAKVWEALSPDSCLKPYEDDYRWLGQVYESVKPPSGSGKLLWHTLGAKTIELIHQNVHVEAVQDNLETLVVDENLLKEIIESQDPKKVKEIEISIIARIRRHSKNLKFVALGQRLEELKERHEKGMLTSLAFLKLLLELAKDVVAAEKEVVPAQEQDRGKAALTELFKEAKNAKTPVMVEHIVGDIDAIVRAVRFDGWQQTTGGEREIKKALRSTLLKYQLHREQELFDRAYEYIRQYY